MFLKGCNVPLDPMFPLCLHSYSRVLFMHDPSKLFLFIKGVLSWHTSFWRENWRRIINSEKWNLHEKNDSPAAKSFIHFLNKYNNHVWREGGEKSQTSLQRGTVHFQRLCGLNLLHASLKPSKISPNFSRTLYLCLSTFWFPRIQICWELRPGQQIVFMMIWKNVKNDWAGGGWKIVRTQKTCKAQKGWLQVSIGSDYNLLVVYMCVQLFLSSH